MTQVKSRSEQDDNIMVQLNQKVDEWQAILAEKDSRIQQLQQQIGEQRELIARQDLDSEKTSIAALTKVYLHFLWLKNTTWLNEMACTWKAKMQKLNNRNKVCKHLFHFVLIRWQVHVHSHTTTLSSIIRHC